MNEAVKEEVIEFLPVEMSVGGKNRYIHFCDHMGQQRFYGVCLHLIESWRRGTLKLDRTVDPQGECAYYMERGTCAALAMRKEETQADRAIYYKPQRKLEDGIATIDANRIDRSNPNYIRGWNQAGSNRALDIKTGETPRAATPAAKPKRLEPSKPVAPKGDGYADLINTMMNEEFKPAAKKEVTAELRPTPVRKEGESMLEMARRLRAEQKANN